VQEGGCMHDGKWEGESARVLGTAKPAEESPPRREERWSWIEPTIWTERMMAALENGVKGGRWYSLMDTD
jgi:RNA-directed DNA polymerase